MMKRRYALIFLMVFLSLTGIALATSGSAIGWQVLSGGGAPASGDVIALNDTLGQPVIGVSSGDNVSLSSGYWYGAPGPIDSMDYIYLPLVVR